MAPALLFLGVVGFGVGVVVGGRDPAAQRRKARARAIRQEADRRLFGELIAIAQNPWNHPAMRHDAWRGASLFKKHWIDAGRSGSRMPGALSLNIYGNWCGPGYGGGECLDEIDCACRSHDFAYDEAAAIEAGRA